MSDSSRFARVLESGRCNFIVTELPDGSEREDIERSIFSVSELCGDNDSFIIYFSGHGFVNRGELFLMLDGTAPESPLNTALHVETILRAMRHCNAQHKLLILDCCHAGAVFSDSRFKDSAIDMKSMVADKEDSASFVALLASDRLERAREFDDLNGSFLTSAICDLLESDTLIGDKDGDGAIDLRDAQSWLSERAASRRANPATRVPVPFIFGRERGKFYLTRDPNDWPIHVIESFGHEYVPLPMWGEGTTDHVWAISRIPVTNRQYRIFVESDHDANEPFGFSYDVNNKSWKDGFFPWRDLKFCDDNLPVVCVDYESARNFSRWVSYNSDFLVDLSPVDVWDMAAFGHPYPSADRRMWLQQQYHHKATAPSSVFHPDRSENKFGVRDLFGNVWEWTGAWRSPARPTIAIISSILDDIDNDQEIRGGSFLDDLEAIRPTLNVLRLEHGAKTSHSDLGFRLAALLPLERLPSDIISRLPPRSRKSSGTWLSPILHRPFFRR